MAWNEPGKGNKDPWGSRGSGGKGNAPDLDELVRNLQRKLSGLFGGGGGNAKVPSGNGSIIGLLLTVLALGWLASGLYQVDAAETGVVLRFGKLQTTTPPGLHWHLPWPIETVHKVNIGEIARFPYRTQMLTKDENIVAVDLTVQYRRSDPAAYLFNVRNADETLSDVTESAIREIVGRNNLDFILGAGRAEIAQQTRELVQQSLNNYGAGLEVTSVNLQDANFPPPVQPAVRDAIKAREDKERLELEAQKYANDIVPRARGAAARRIEDAEAYRAEVIAEAEGQSARFTQLLAEYARAPGVTRQRLYLETMEKVLGSTSKVLVTTEGGGNIMYLPLDQLLQKQREAGAQGASLPLIQQSPADNAAGSREASRARGGR